MLENAAIAVGRLGLVCPDEVATQLSVFAAAFVRALSDVRDNEEKDSAFRGFCTLIGKNPSGLSSDLTEFVIAVAKYSEPSPELAEMFHTVICLVRGQELTGRFCTDTKALLVIGESSRRRYRHRCRNGSQNATAYDTAGSEKRKGAA